MEIDSSITELDLSSKNLSKLPDLSIYPNLKKLKCSYNKLTKLDNLPSNLEELECYNNQLTSLDNLPSGLQELVCLDNPFNYDFEPTLENIRLWNLGSVP